MKRKLGFKRTFLEIGSKKKASFGYPETIDFDGKNWNIFSYSYKVLNPLEYVQLREYKKDLEYRLQHRLSKFDM